MSAWFKLLVIKKSAKSDKHSNWSSHIEQTYRLQWSAIWIVVTSNRCAWWTPFQLFVHHISVVRRLGPAPTNCTAHPLEPFTFWTEKKLHKVSWQRKYYTNLFSLVFVVANVWRTHIARYTYDGSQKTTWPNVTCIFLVLMFAHNGKTIIFGFSRSSLMRLNRLHVQLSLIAFEISHVS